jgi:multidrug efflux pump subunit AcrB
MSGCPRRVSPISTSPASSFRSPSPETVEQVRATWPLELRDSVRVDTTLDQSVQVDGMVRQLEGSVLTAIALVMIVVLAALGTRSAMLVGFAIPTSFLLCFILLGVIGIPISNIVMFGLILAVGMLVDGAIVVVEYADKRLQQGARPDAGLYRRRQADVLAHRVLHRDDALCLPADAVLARCGG